MASLVGIAVIVLWLFAIVCTTDYVWRIPVVNMMVIKAAIWLEEKRVDI